MLKVINGTPKGNKSLCVTCRYAHTVTGLNLQQATICQYNGLNRTLPFPIETCSHYSDSRTPPLWEMQEIAWQVTARKRGHVGFAEGAPKLDIVIEPPKRNSSDISDTPES